MEDPIGGSNSGHGGPWRGVLETPRGLGAGVLCPRRCGRDRCAPAQSPPPGSSPPLRGGDGGRKMAAGRDQSRTSPAAWRGLQAGHRAGRRGFGA